MSEQNILNPYTTSLFCPDYPLTHAFPEMRTVLQATSGKLFSRRQMARGRVYPLVWNSRDTATMHALLAWERQFENDFFTIVDWYRGRSFSGRFDSPLQYSAAGNEQWNIKGNFVELPGLALWAYPGDFNRDAIFQRVRNGSGEDLVKLTGAWTYAADNNARGLGKQSLKVAASAQFGAAFSASFPSVPGDVWAIQAWAKSDSGKIADAQIQFLQSNGTFISGIQPTTTNAGWTLLQQSGVAPALTDHVVVSLQINDVGGGTGYFKNVSITKNGDLVPLRNPDFEEGSVIPPPGWASSFATLSYDASTPGGAQYTSPNTNTTDKAEWVYFGYGFQLWAQKGSNLGILSAQVTRVRDGAVMGGPANFDLYNATVVPSGAIWTVQNLPLDLYRVSITATNTKNASSSAKTIIADVLQVMQ